MTSLSLRRRIGLAAVKAGWLTKEPRRHALYSRLEDPAYEGYEWVLKNRETYIWAYRKADIYELAARILGIPVRKEKKL